MQLLFLSFHFEFILFPALLHSALALRPAPPRRRPPLGPPRRPPRFSGSVPPQEARFPHTGQRVRHGAHYACEGSKRLVLRGKKRVT